MKIDIIGGSYQQKYKEYNSAKTINWYPVTSTDSEKDKSQTALFPTPGLTLFTTPPGRYSRGLFTARTHNFTRCFAVVDNILYEILDNMTFINRGVMANLGIGSTKVYMTCDANDEVGIFGYQASYVFNMGLNTLAQITTPQFPGFVQYADYLDGFTIIVSLGAIFYNLNNNLQGGWLQTQQFSPTFKPAPVLAAVALREEIYAFTSQQIEIYINDGTPYSRLPRSTLSIGLAARESIVVINDGFVFLGKTIQGETNVYVFDGGYNISQISPFSVNYALNQAPLTLEGAHAFIQYTKDGHIMYHLTIPGLNTTYVYDLTTKMWWERQSINPVNSSDGNQNAAAFRGRHHTNFNGKNLMADSLSSTIFNEDFSNFTENGTVIIRTRISQTYSQEYQNITVGSLEIDCNTGYGALSGQGSNPLLMISISTDGGYNYREPRNITLGVQGDHLFRARKHMLGTARNWVIKLSLSDPIDLMMQNCIARGTVSSY